VTWRGLVFPLIFLASIPFALIGPTWPIVLWVGSPAVYAAVGRFLPDQG
jgi:hypothetical protein